MATGVLFSLVFALLPLLEVRHASPLLALRLASGTERPPGRLWETLAVYALIAAAATAFAVTHTDRWRQGVGFVAGLAGAFALLAGLARLLVLAVRRWTPRSLPFAWRQGLANLHRPNNRTTLLLLSLGLGTFVLLTLYLTQGMLIRQVLSEGGSGRPNAVFFDIQPDQRDGVRALLAAQGVPLLDEAPIVTMRLAGLKGRSIDEWLADTNRSVARWALRREYRSTWRDTLTDAESLVAGVWHPRYDPAREVVPVSVEEGIARELGLGLGDSISFDIQGVPMSARVASLRKVEWRRVQPNFFVVFPPGVLESAPAFYVAVTRTASPAQSAALQRAMVERFPNVSAIDLTLVLGTLDAVLRKVTLAIRFMALFTVATGLLVLAGAILVSRHQRMRESILLRTLGASAAQIRRVLVAEYASLGLLAALAAGLLALGGSGLLAHYVFRVAWSVDPLPVVLALGVVPSLTVLTGLLSSRGVATHPPMEILRQESM
jgi:putative ABC transport system permease protein